MARKELSRRSFLKGAAAGTAGVAAASMLGGSAFAEPDAVSSTSAVSENEFGQQVVRVLDGEGVTQITNTIYSTDTWERSSAINTSAARPGRSSRQTAAWGPITITRTCPPDSIQRKQRAAS